MSDYLVDKRKPLVIKKRIKAKHAPHGGAWKVAYADFVTAMMAFFLLLWLLNVTTESNKQGISNYFEPDTSEEEKLAGSGQALAGLAEVAEGALKSAGSPPRVTVALATAGSKTGGDEGKETVEDAAALAEAEAKRLQAELESFAKVEAEIRQALQEIPELNDMQDSLMIDYSPDGLRIQILDDEDIPMFAAGRAVLNDHGRKMLAIIANVITKMPNLVVVTDIPTVRAAVGRPTVIGNCRAIGPIPHAGSWLNSALVPRKSPRFPVKRTVNISFPKNRIRFSIVDQYYFAETKTAAKMPDNDQQASILEAQDL